MFVVKHLAFLYDDYDAKIVYSHGGRGPASVIELEMENVRIWIPREMGEICLYMQANEGSYKKEWFDSDILHEFLTGSSSSGLMDAREAKFIKKHMDELNDAFSPQNRDKTKAKMMALVVARDKHRWR